MTDIVQPPTSPPWVRPAVIDRFIAGDPSVLWESLSSQEQAEVFDRHEQMVNPLGVVKEDIRVRKRLEEIQDRTLAAFEGAIITDPSQARRSIQREVARWVNCHPDEVDVEFSQGLDEVRITLPPIVEVSFSVPLSGHIEDV